MKTRTCTTCPPARRGAALYLAVMGVSLLVSLLGLAGLKLVQLERHQIQQQNNRIAASQYAGTALALAKLKMQNDPNWRTTYANGVESPLYPLDSSGRGTISWRLVDTDGSLSDRDTNLKLLGIGRIGNAVQVSCVDLTVSNALEILNMAVHADGNFTNGSGKVLTVNGAPASSNILVNNGGNLTADVDTVSFSNTGTYTGTAVTDQDVKQMPVSNLFDEYVVLATELTYDGSIDKMLITPSVNQYDTPLNAQGLYYINTGSRGLDIKDSRIQGTLIIDAGTSTVSIGNNVLIEPADTGYATLLIRASAVYLEYDS
ncbi:MAG: hypothetical protein KDA78_21245, partial [Planctomycetaceae bacterium]|nr:hypothetical protein [Planctomycetaceae bacterium]